MALNIVNKNSSLYLPEPARIVETANFTESEKFFKVELLNRASLNHDPGQFVQVSMLGVGEAPISVSSPPSDDPYFEMCVRAVGDVTKKLDTLKKGDLIYIRGPFGQGFDAEIQNKMKGKHLLFISGGLGYVPLRSLINKVVKEKNQYQKISVLNGWKRPSDRLYTDELTKLIHEVELLETVDKPDENWKGNVGVITTLIPKITFDPAQTIAVIVGPPIMYQFVLKTLLDKKMPKESIYMSLERRMRCGVGKCGHCQMESVYVCQKGPVFNYADVEHNEEVF